MKKVALVALCFWLISPSANGQPAHCGSNLQEVKEILARKFPQLDASFTDTFVGTWIYPGYDPMVIALNRPFQAMGYILLICPRADKTFLVKWKQDGSRAGILAMSGRNQVTIYQTSYGDIPLERAGSMNAGR